jgi:hypothetical protein
MKFCRLLTKANKIKRENKFIFLYFMDTFLLPFFFTESFWVSHPNMVWMRVSSIHWLNKFRKLFSDKPREKERKDKFRKKFSKNFMFRVAKRFLIKKWKFYTIYTRKWLIDYFSSCWNTTTTRVVCCWVHREKKIFECFQIGFFWSL